MKQHIHSILFLAGTLLAGVFTACTDDFVNERTTTPAVVDDSNLVETRLALNVAAMGSPTVTTRATGDSDPMQELSDEEKRGSDEERQIDNIWVFQFDASGNLLITPRYYDLSTVAITPDEKTPGTVEVLLKPDVESTVYVVANTGDATWATAASSPTLASLEKLPIPDPKPITVNDNGSPSGRIPMEGHTEEYVTPGNDGTISVKVTRMYAKVEIRVGDIIPETIVITDIDAGNIPYYCTVKSLHKEDENDAQGVRYPDGTQWLSHAFKPGDKNEAMVLYIPENLQGQLQRGDQNKPEYKTQFANPNAFSLDYKANYVSFGDIVESGRSYVFYPGADDWRDYNIKRNRIYRASLNIYSDLYDQPIPSSNCFVVKPGQLLSFLPYYRTEEGGGYKFSDYLAPGDDAKSITDERDDMTRNVKIIWQTKDAIGDNSKGDLVWIDNATGTDSDTKQRKIYVRAGKKGNALIAAYNRQGEIVWSWHIWVTENDPANVSSAVTYSTYAWNEDGINTDIRVPGYAIMPCNLGALAYEPTEVNSVGVDPKTHGMLYQWGRKDPFPPAERGNNVEYDDEYTGYHYGNDNSTLVTKTSGTDESILFHSLAAKDLTSVTSDAINYTIQNPTVFLCGTKEANKNETYISTQSNYQNTGDWRERHDNKLWGGKEPTTDGSMKYFSLTNNDVEAHIFDNYGDQKSIFDPCPSGWRVPPGDLWLGFTSTGVDPKDMSEVNTDEEKNNIYPRAGMYLYMTAWKSGQTVFFPTQGTRTPDGRIMRTNQCGNYHNATTDVNNRVNILHVHNDTYGKNNPLFHVFETQFIFYYVKSVGGPVRCVRDHK